MDQILIVLGGGIDKDGNMPPWVHARLDKALLEWQRGVYALIITTGKGREGAKKAEADSMARFLASNGVPKEKILIEDASTSTVENAYFCRTQYLDKLEAKRLMLVTNQFHIERAETIFKFVFGPDYTVDVAASDDTGIADDVHDLLHESDIEQARFLHDHVFNKIEAGNLEQIRSFIYDTSNESRKSWSSYKSNSEIYQKVTKLMT